MRVSFALMSCLFASVTAPVFTACGDDTNESPDDGLAGSGPSNTGGRIATGGRGGGGGASDGGSSAGGEPTELGGTTGGTLGPGPFAGSAGEGGEAGFGVGNGGGRGGAPPATNPCIPSPCENGASCAVQDDLVVCGCRDGYEGTLCELDVNECLVDNGGCGEAECLNLEGTFKCGGCDAGYTPDEAGVCVDVDECETLTAPCDPRTDCTNTPGGYECSPCPAGLQGVPKQGCRDIDECLRQPCDELSNCTNLFGSYLCSACPPGYDGDGKSCTDIDECLFENGGCEVPLRTCINTPGSFKCDVCPAGYIESGAFECADVDECLLKADNCDEFPDVVCHNLVGSFECVDATPDACKTADDCKVGFDCLDTGTSLQCVNIDECDTGEDDCKVGFDCVDTEGSWLCTPQDDGGDDGPCTTFEDCPPGHVCNTLFGDCVACPVGFTGVCNNICYDFETSEEHCGFCDNPCADGVQCVGANCQVGDAD